MMYLAAAITTSKILIKQTPMNDKEKSAYVNLRILTYDTNKDGKKEIIIVKNLSSVGRVFKHLKAFYFQ